MRSRQLLSDERPVIERRYEYEGTLVRVIDGDTIQVDLTQDIGLSIRVTVRWELRLNGCNAPERATAAGPAATHFVETWWATHRAPFVVRTYKDKREKYGRYLADVRDADGHDLVTDLIAAGHAVPWDGLGVRPV